MYITDGANVVSGENQSTFGRYTTTDELDQQKDVNISIPANNHSQDVRVDNWGNYCLQRLHIMYEKGDFCDLILQFHNNQILKVHRVVVNLCTEYFANMERSCGLVAGMLVLPSDIEFQAMLTIIKFFYTGKLEVRGSQFQEIYKTVRAMNVAILVKLLEAHARKPILQAKTSNLTCAKQTPEMEESFLTEDEANLPDTAYLKPSMGRARLLNSGLGKAISRPLPAGVKTKTVLARVQSQGVARRVTTPGVFAAKRLQKKLPIWKERKYTPMANTQTEQFDRWPVKDEPAKPTRFDWPDQEDETNPAAHSVNANLSKSKGKGLYMRRSEDIFDSVKIQNLKRPAPTLISSLSGTEVKGQFPAQMPPKVAKFSDEIEKELAAMENSDQEDEDLIVSPGDIQLQAETTLKTAPAEPSYPANASSSKAVLATEDSFLASEEPPPSNCSNNASDQRCSDSESQSLTNHSKIISEVLKKYPDLVRDNKNIKLKIVQKASATKVEKCKEPRSKVSYIVLKSTSSTNTMGSPLLSKKLTSSAAGSKPARSSFWDPPGKPVDLNSAADNVLGPWFCNRCTQSGQESQDSNVIPFEFDSYYNYRRHLVECHGERIDARICEHCGYKASKRNLLLHHLYTKHGIPTPKNCYFPHCDKCDYVGLSESLLTKHQQGHTASKEFVCNAHVRSTHKDMMEKEVSNKVTLFIGAESGIVPPGTNTQAIQSVEKSEQEHIEQEAIISYGTLLLDGSANEVLEEISSKPSVSDLSAVAASFNTESQHQLCSEYVTAIGPDGQQTVYILDNSVDQDGVSIDEENNGSGDPPYCEPFIVQDIHGNQFQRMTGIDESGTQVVYFQLTEEAGSVADSQIHNSENTVEDDIVSTLIQEVDNGHPSVSIQNDHIYLDPQKRILSDNTAESFTPLDDCPVVSFLPREALVQHILTHGTSSGSEQVHIEHIHSHETRTSSVLSGPTVSSEGVKSAIEQTENGNNSVPDQINTGDMLVHNTEPNLEEMSIMAATQQEYQVQ